MHLVIINVEQGVFLEAGENPRPSPIADFFTCPSCCYKLLITAVRSLPLAPCCTTSSPGICSKVLIKLGISVHLFVYFKAECVIHVF